MSGVLAWEVQVAAIARWKADASVAAAVADRVFDGEAEEGAALPYVVVGDHTEREQGTVECAGGVATLTAHTFSAYRGTKEVLAIVAAMDAALATELLALETYGAARLAREFLDVQMEEDGVRHAVARYRIFSLGLPE